LGASQPASPPIELPSAAGRGEHWWPVAVPFTSDTDLKAQLQKANVPPDQAEAILKANSDARLAALRTSLWVVALIAAALFFTGLIPTEPIGPTKPQLATPDPAQTTTS
jgi:hypothetical protein